MEAAILAISDGRVATKQGNDDVRIEEIASAILRLVYHCSSRSFSTDLLISMALSFDKMPADCNT